MKTSISIKSFVISLCIATLGIQSLAYAASGYMSLLDDGPLGTSVVTGDAASYMRIGTDWDGSTCNPMPCTAVDAIATPTLLQQSKITTWRDTSALHFKFEIPDSTTTASGATLACGDQVIVQIGPANSSDTQLQAGKEFRFEVVIQNNLITPQPIGATNPTGSVAKRLPYSSGPLIGTWKATAEASTTASAILATGGNKYTINLDIPFSEINNPTGDIGLALAIINDLGHSHGSPAINEASGTAFPLGMGLTPESEPGLTCGAPTAPSGVTASGNWRNPSTWGIGYVSLANATPDVTFRQDDSFYISKAIRLGKCAVNRWDDIGEVTLGNWQYQNTIPNWYEYNPPGTTSNPPCRMGIWMDANVNFPQTNSGIIKKRFLVVWGRPGIAPQDWYFAGLTEPVAITAPHTPVSFLWNNVPNVNFSSHPCMRVYILPENLTQAEIDTIKNIDTADKLAAMEATYGVVEGSLKSAQMNFTNIGNTGGCTDNACKVLSSVNRYPLLASMTDSWLISDAEAADIVAARSENPGELHFDVTNPRLAAKNIVGSKITEIRSRPRRIFVAMETAVRPGTPMPKLDIVQMTDKIPRGPMEPGQTVNNVVVKIPSAVAPGTTPARTESNLVRITARAFGVAEPIDNKRYVYVEEIGGLAWATRATVAVPDCKSTTCKPCPKVSASGGNWNMPGVVVLLGSIAGVGGFAFRKRKSRRDDRGPSA